MADGQIHPLDESGIEPSRKAHPLQGCLEIGFGHQAHHVRDLHQLAPPVTFFHLTIDQAHRHLPLGHVAAPTNHLEPLYKK